MAWVIPTKFSRTINSSTDSLLASGFNFGDCTNLVNSSRLMFPSPWKNARKTVLPHWEGKTPNFRRHKVKNSSGEHHLEMRSAYIDMLYRYPYNNIYCILYVYCIATSRSTIPSGTDFLNGSKTKVFFAGRPATVLALALAPWTVDRDISQTKWRCRSLGNTYNGGCEILPWREKKTNVGV